MWERRTKRSHGGDENKDKTRNVRERLLVSLELPGNLKVWLKSHCQVIIAGKQSVAFYNYSEGRITKKQSIYVRSEGPVCRLALLLSIKWSSMRLRPCDQLFMIQDLYTATSTADIMFTSIHWTTAASQLKMMIFLNRLEINMIEPFSTPTVSVNIQRQTVPLSAFPLLTAHIKALVKQPWWD